MKLANSYLVFLLPFVLVISFSSAQTQKLDSLKLVLETADDTTKVNALRLLGVHSRVKNKENAISYGLKSLEEARKIGFVQGEIKALYALGSTYGRTGSYSESLNYLNQCLSLAKGNKNYFYMKISYGSLGIVYKSLGDYPKSKNFYLKSLKLVDSLNLPFDTSSAYSNLGILYDLMDQPEQAILSYKKALEVYKGNKREVLENNVLANLALIEMDNEEYEAALKKYLKIKEYNKENNRMISLCTNYSNIGHCYLKLGKWGLSKQYLTESLKLAEELSIEKMIPVIYYNLADLMLQQGKYDLSIVYVKKNIDFLNGPGKFKYKLDAHEIAHEVYNKVGNYPKAISHLKKTIDFKDSLLNETRIKEIENLQVRHNVFLKDKEIEESELKLALLNTRVSLNRKRLQYLAIIAILLTFSATLLYFRFRAKKKANAILQNKNELISQQKKVIEEMNHKMEKQMLRAQMNPHFIFNSLNSIQHLINTDNRVSALKYLTKFSKLLRQVLESSINVSLVLKEEIELLKIYLELESLRFDNSFSYTIHIDENLDVEEHEVPMLLVQPYIENAIIHGLMPKNGPKNLSIWFNDKKDFIECTIEDDGVGIPTRPKKEKVTRPSRGMSITAQRIAVLEKFSNQELLTIENLKDGAKNGTRVTILIPKHKLEDKQLSKQAV